jgi:hypothetical protein
MEASPVPLTVGEVSAGVVLDGAQLVPGMSHTVTFDGKGSVTIPAGAQVLSDLLAGWHAPAGARMPARNSGDLRRVTFHAFGALNKMMSQTVPAIAMGVRAALLEALDRSYYWRVTFLHARQCGGAHTGVGSIDGAKRGASCRLTAT